MTTPTKTWMQLSNESSAGGARRVMEASAGASGYRTRRPAIARVARRASISPVRDGSRLGCVIDGLAVRITGGPTRWDYVVGGCTIAATVVALIAIGFALKAGRDLVHDRRQVFELGVLLALYEQTQALSSIPVDRTMQARVRLVPEAELPSLHELVLNPKLPKVDETDVSGGDLDARSEYKRAMRERAMHEIEQAIAKRTH